MAKSVKIVRTFPNAWYKFIVEGDATGLSQSERMIAESAIASAFPDGGDIVAAKIGTTVQKYSTLVCESYSVNGCSDKTEGKTFKVKVLADEVKNPETYKKYVGEGIDDLRKRRDAEIARAEELSDENTTKKDSVKSAKQLSDVDMVKSVSGGNPNRFDVTARVFDEWKNVFGTYLDKDAKTLGGEGGKKVSPEGSETVTQEDAAKQLQSEIVKAYEKNDKERLRELRPLIPLIAWYLATYKRSFTTLFNAMTQLGDDLKTTGYHRIVEVLPVIYDVAFGLDESAEAREKAEKYIGETDAFKKKIGKQKDNASEEARREYAEMIFKKVFYGTVLPEKIAADVTNNSASVQNTNYNRTERSTFNTYSVPFIRWFRANKDRYGLEGTVTQQWSKTTPYEFNFAKGMYLIESLSDYVEDVERKMSKMKMEKGVELTADNIEAAFAQKIAYKDEEKHGGEKYDSRKMKCFRGLLKNTWENLGLPTEDVEDKGGRKDTKLLGKFDGTFDEFKEEFKKVSEETKTRLDGCTERLVNEYSDYQDKHEEEMQEIISGLDSGKMKRIRHSLSEFNLRTDTSVFGDENIGFIKNIATEKMQRLVFELTLDKFRRDQINEIGKSYEETCMANDQQASRVSDQGDDGETDGDASEKNDGGLDDTDASGDSDDEVQDASTDGGDATTDQDYDAESDPDALEFKDLNEKFLSKSDEEIEKDAKDLHLDPERAKKISSDWEKICSNPGGMAGMLNLTNRNTEGKKDLENIEDIRKEAEELIAKEEERRESEYEAAKAEYDDAKDGGDKAAIKEAKRELDKAEKNRKLSSKEKAEITRKVKAAKVGDRGIDIKTNPTALIKSGLANAAGSAGAMALNEIVQHYGYMLAPNGTDEDTYVGLPDMLVLMLHDQIMAFKETHPDDSLEYCIDKIAKFYRSDYHKAMVRMSGIDMLAADTLRNESVEDKYLESVEKLLDMIEQSDADPQTKIDMLEAVATGFRLWCEENDVVPQEVNPEEDKDAIANHPEDAE